MQAVLLAGLTLRQFASQYAATHFAPQFHVRVHSRLPRGGVRLVAVVPLQALLTLPRVGSRAPRFSTVTQAPSRATVFNRRLHVGLEVADFQESFACVHRWLPF
jgi:hypothetical protein